MLQCWYAKCKVCELAMWNLPPPQIPPPLSPPAHHRINTLTNTHTQTLPWWLLYYTDYSESVRLVHTYKAPFAEACLPARKWCHWSAMEGFWGYCVWVLPDRRGITTNSLPVFIVRSDNRCLLVLFKLPAINLKGGKQWIRLFKDI